MDEFSQILATARQQLLEGLLSSTVKIPPGLFTVVAQDPQTLVATLLQNTVEYEATLPFVAEPQSKVIVKNADGKTQILPVVTDFDVSENNETEKVALPTATPLDRIDRATANLEKTLRSIVRENMQPDRLLSPIDRSEVLQQVAEKIVSSIRTVDFSKIPAEKLSESVSLLTLFQGKLTALAEEAGTFVAAKIFLKLEWQAPVRDSLWQKVLQATMPELEQKSSNKSAVTLPANLIRNVLESAGLTSLANVSEKKIVYIVERALTELSTGKPDLGLTLLVAEKSPEIANERQTENQPTKLLQTFVKTLLALGDDEPDLRALVTKHKSAPDRMALTDGLNSLREKETKTSPSDQESIRKQGLAVLNRLAEPERVLSAVEQAQNKASPQISTVPNIFLPHPGVISVAGNSHHSEVDENDSKKKKKTAEQREGVEVTLTLPSLGEVQVNLTVDPVSGHAAVQLLVESNDRRLLMETHSHLLKNALSKVGIGDSTIIIKQVPPALLPSNAQSAVQSTAQLAVA